MNNKQITSFLDNYKRLYDGCFWNLGLNDESLSAEKWGVTRSAVGKENEFGNAYQCYGFSLFLAYALFGKRLSYGEVFAAPHHANLGDGWTLYRGDYSEISLEPGDIVRGNNDCHSAVVWKVENGKVYVVECWGSVNNKLSWGFWNGTPDCDSEDKIKRLATYIIKAPKNKETVCVFFDGNGGACERESKQVVVGDTYGDLPVCRRDGYSFVGWWPERVVETEEYHSQKRVMASYDHTLFAHWAKAFKIVNLANNKCLNIWGENLKELHNELNVTIWRETGSNEQKWLIADHNKNSIRSVIDPKYGLNVFRSGFPFNCNIRKIAGNECDAVIDLIPCGKSYLIKLSNYPLYLSMSGYEDGSNVFWGYKDVNLNQMWSIVQDAD